MNHKLHWMSSGTSDYRWECTCGYRPSPNWPQLIFDQQRHESAA